MINNNAIKREKVTKFLCVFLDQNISWKPHIDRICSKLCKSIGMIYKARQTVSKNSCIFLSLIITYFVPM